MLADGLCFENGSQSLTGGIVTHVEELLES